MATAKKPARKRKIRASDVEVGNRTLEGVLADVAERSARAEEVAADAAKRSARAEELAQIALDNISALLRDLRALAGRTNDRLDALEKNAAE
jgi:hypothetical protein